jgi:hypothetical protein
MEAPVRLVRVRIAISLAAALLVGGLAAACVSSSAEGDECSSDGDCADQLSCQLILGRGCTEFCCPTPPSTSSADNCQEKTVDGVVPPYPTTCGVMTPPIDSGL